MFKSTHISVILFLVLVGLLLAVHFAPAAAQSKNVVVPAAPIAESNDYATLHLADPWDMSEYSDVSQYMNESGERDVVRNLTVEDGVFSGTSAGDVIGLDGKQNGWFFTLFPGYETAIHAGKAGSKTPIDSSYYNCFYIAMNVASGAANSFGPDQYRIFWFGDDRLNTGGAPYGFTTGLPLYPEYGATTPVPIWKLYKVDLANTSLPPGVSGLTPWNGKTTWEGLRIDPTINANINYKVDWVRLTNCAPQTTDITFNSDNNISAVWLRPEGTSRYILIATDVNGTSGLYSLDTQGVQPGSYYVGFGDQFTCCTTESTELLTVNQTPIVNFQNPTFYSGPDFATLNGNAWDMSSAEDYSGIRCADFGDENGYLWLETPPNIVQPDECRGTDPQQVSDPSILLNMPTLIDPATYRYLSFRMSDDNPWQFVAQGSIIRWVWTVQGDSGLPGHRCYLVSQDIPFDVGWHTYSIDLWDTFEGSAEDWEDECDSLPKNWQQSPPVLQARFDPNENISDHTFYNKIDWIRLTKPIVIPRGQAYRLGLDKFFPNDIFEVNLFYTTDPKNQPTQHRVIVYTSPGSTGPYAIYLPITKSMGDPFLSGADLEYLWDTTSVSPGKYYICAEAFDGLNQGTFCSEATITITN